MTKLLRHPLSAAFGDMTPERRAELRASITEVGVKLPITIYEGMVLDGWNRYTVADELEVACPKEPLGRSEDPVAFVRAMNLPRRDYTDSQRAMIIVRLHEWRPVGRRVEEIPPSGRNNDEQPAPAAPAPKSSEQMAEEAGVGTRTIERAKVVEQKGTPELKAQVLSGEVSVRKAADIANGAVVSTPAEKPAAPPAPKKEKPEPPAWPDQRARVAELETQVEDLATVNKEISEDNASMLKILEADPRVKEALAEAKRFRDSFHAAEDRIRGFQNEKNELIRTIRSLERRMAGTK